MVIKGSAPLQRKVIRNVLFSEPQRQVGAQARSTVGKNVPENAVELALAEIIPFLFRTLIG